jgi:hypothetical protein
MGCVAVQLLLGVVDVCILLPSLVQAVTQETDGDYVWVSPDEQTQVRDEGRQGAG